MRKRKASLDEKREVELHRERKRIEKEKNYLETRIRVGRETKEE